MTGTEQANLIVDKLLSKNKIDLRRRKDELRKQVLFFSPAYRDFILKIVSSNSLKIKHRYKSGSYLSLNDGNKKFSKRQPATIKTDINDRETLPHELGHAVDLWFGQKDSLTNNVIIEDDKTLNDIFTEEFNEKHETLYHIVMDEYKSIINSNINDKAYDIFMNNIGMYIELLDYPSMKDRKLLQEALYENGFVEVYYQIITKNCSSILNKKYSPILDALSSKHDLTALDLRHHTLGYYRSNNNHPVEEFFANVFAAKVTANNTQFDNLIKYLPKSFSAFEKLFVIFYDHIQNNKRFNDVKLKQREETYDDLSTVSE